jgi:RNA polymerase sigma factor (sigma-70 family)
VILTREDELLQRYAAKQSEAAFAELVQRYLNFVYSVCRRQVGNDALAQDVTQTVFLLLAAKAGSLKPGTVLSGWLFRTAHLACRNALRVEARRQHYERKAAQEMEDAARGLDPQWQQVESGLDEALAQLSTPDRDALLLRYVEELSLEEMAAALGISAAAAHKRVSRALERTRHHFARAGATLTVTALGLILAEKMVQAAPPMQAAAILSAVTGPGLVVTAVSPSLWGQAAAQMGLSKARVVLVACLVGAVVAGGGWGVFHSVRGGAASGKAVTPGAPVQYTTLRGRILDTAGKPASGVSVTFLRYGAEMGTETAFAQTRTDSGGHYAIARVPVGPDSWSIIADSGKSLGFGMPGRDCGLLPPTQVRLRLVDTNGRPAVGVRLQPLILTLAEANGNPVTVNLSVGCPIRLQSSSDVSGQVTFAGLPQGAVASFAVLDTKYVRRPPAADGLVLASAASSGSVTVSLQPGASVTGQVVYGPMNLPAAGVRLGAQQIGTSAWGEAVTDANGRYQIAQLLPGRYNLAVDEQSAALGGDWTAAAIPGLALGTGQRQAGQDLRLVPGVLITGKVTMRGSGRPAVGVEIGAYGPAHPRTGAWVSGGWTGSDGAYQIRVPPGRQHVYSMSGAASSPGVDVTLTNGRDAAVDFALPPS